MRVSLWLLAIGGVALAAPSRPVASIKPTVQRGKLPARSGSPRLLQPAIVPVPIPTQPVAIPTPTPVPLEMFPFALPPFDNSKNAVDVSWMNEIPAGKSGFLRAQGEHFVDGQGRVLRFWGVNISYQGAFPSKDEAPKVAGRLAKFGFNAVRLHQYETSTTPGSLWKSGGIGSSRIAQPREVDPEQLDRLDFFIAELIKRGIYINLNLHVGRKVLESDGVPQAAALPEKDKGANYFEPRLVQLQKEFSRLMLTRVNPYLGRALKDEPGLAMVEVTNENSLLAMWLDDRLDRIPAEVLAPLQVRWNGWLKQRYDEESLRAAWTEWDEMLVADDLLGVALPPNVLNPDAPDAQVIRAQQNLAQWKFQTVAPASGTAESDVLSGATIDGVVRPGLTLNLATAGNIKAPGAVPWSFRLVRSDIPLQEEHTYSLSFWARAEKPRRAAITVAGGFYTVCNLTSDWKKFHFALRTGEFKTDARQITISLGNETGTVQFSEPEMHAGGVKGVPENWTLENGVPLPDFRDTGVLRARKDMAQFLGEIETEHCGQMRDFLKKEIGVRCPMWHTQAQFGGWGGLWREAQSDAIDQHAYWKHPELGENGWAAGEWKVGNQSMVTAGDDNPLSAFALFRLEGKPFVMSEWNSGVPNDFGAESLPMAAALAAWHDWAGVFVFDYHARGEYGRDRIEGPFSIDSHPVKMALAPAAALIYRRPSEGNPPGDLQTAKVANVLTMPTDWLWREVASVGGPPFATPMVKTWREAGGARADALRGRTSVRFAEPGAVLFPTVERAVPGETGHFTSDTGEIHWDEKPAFFTVNTPRSKFLAGYLGGRMTELDELQLTAPTSQTNWLCAALESLDGEPVADSKKLLLTVAGRAENLGMGKGPTPGLGGTAANNFWGRGPTQVEGVNLAVRLRTALTAPRVWALDTSGNRTEELPTTLEDGALRFKAGPEWKTVWYEVGE